jgi:hypothetical protein
MAEAVKAQGWLPVYDKPRDRGPNELEGGIRTPSWFNIEVLFQTYDDFKGAEEELRNAGFVVELIADAFDECSAGTTFSVVSKFAGTATDDDLWNQVEALVAPFDGYVDCGEIVGPVPYRRGDA